MKQQLFLTVFTLIVLLVSCQNKQDHRSKTPADTNAITQENSGEGVPYDIVKGYFVKNTVSEKNLENPKIEDEETFNQYFGAATTMGEEGKPTTIDFTKQFVIAVIEASTEHLTTIAPISLANTGSDQLTLTYRVEKGEKQSYTQRPVLLLVVDKIYNQEVVLEESK
ncbi:hypothetical protein H8S90_15855 [Olivibacter sp. SDN3]|uniref:hypothetical protein n=1 Tax=Olivibacter sp. SDN3 TaxID=2764720 RepID=UPI00165117EF|nr:hypothetical protein [Olivibacter sp. SDN3]QNL48268.1 hypothetical protein H8S90_15855 [Olivibacter sp. SDN3]